MGRTEKVKQQKVQERISKHIRDLGSPDQKVSARAEGYLLRWYGVRALEPLIAACSDANLQVRFRSAWVLASTHDSRAYESILRLTQDPDGRSNLNSHTVSGGQNGMNMRHGIGDAGEAIR